VSGLKIQVNREVCIGSGMCALTAPAVFDQDEDEGRVLLLDDAPSPSLEDAVTQAEAVCPSGAIEVTP
jgi:ferredoxin